MNVDSAIAHSIHSLKAGKGGNYGFDFHPATAARHALENQQGGAPRDLEQHVRKCFPFFAEAGWELCRRGILRPGQNSEPYSEGKEQGYSLTQTGKDRLQSLDESDLLILQPGALAATFTQFNQRFGEGFDQRAQEAIKCRNSEAWLACCTMVGAAAESVLLALAIEKDGDEKEVLRVYQTASGRRKLIDMLCGQASQRLQNDLRNFTGVLWAWRDVASHGTRSTISSANSDESLRQLLHMCQWADAEWRNLTS